MEDFFKIDGDQLGRTDNFNLHLFTIHRFHFDQPITNVESPMQLTDLRERHAGHLAVEIDRIQIGHPGNKVDN